MAAKAGISGQAFYNVVANGSGGCTVTKAALENIIDRKFEGTGSHIATMHKDLTISMNLGEQLGVPLHTAAAAMQIFHAGKTKYPHGDTWVVPRVIEEIIGEIQDEHEGDEPQAFQSLSGGRIRIWGGTSLREVSQRFDFEPTEDEDEGYDTIGGFVLGRLDRIPVVGDEVEVETGHFRVTQMSGRRIDYLLFMMNR